VEEIPMKVPTRFLALSACAALTFANAAAYAHETDAPSAKSADTLSSMKVTRDKETGRLRMTTPEEDAALRNTARSSRTPSVLVVRRPATTIEVRPNGSAVGKRSLDDMENLVMTRKPDGTVVMSHSHSPAPAAPLE
jgi:hypothetical protein